MEGGERTGAERARSIDFEAGSAGERPCAGSFRDGRAPWLVGRSVVSVEIVASLIRIVCSAGMSLVLDKYDVMDEERSMKIFSYTFAASQFFGKERLSSRFSSLF